MFVDPFEFRAKSSLVKLFCLSSLALSIGASGAWGAVPAVVIDTQQTIGTGLNNPQAIAVNNTNQGAIFIADTNNNQLVALLSNGFSFAFQPPGFTLSTPQALALDTKGDLFIGDTPTSNGSSVGRVIEMTADGTGNLTGAAQLVYSGAPLTNPTSLTVDSAGTLFIGDFPPSGVGAIYSLAAGGTTPQLLNITGGPPAQFFPSALVRDSSNNLYFADNGNLQGSNGAVYVVSDAGGTAAQVATQSFLVNQPTGLALNAAGDLYILTLLGTGTGFNAGQQVLVIPAASPTTPYIVPNNGIGTGSGLAFDAKSNLDVVDSFNGDVVQLAYGNPTNLGNVNVGQAGPQIGFNFEFNAPATLRGFRVVTQGDVSTDLTQISGGTCTNGAHNNLPHGGPAVSPYFPYTCAETYEGTPTFPGIRTSAILVRGPANTILASTPVYETGFAGVEITYPLDASNTATNLQQPQAVAISGDNKTVYVADTQAGKVYSTGGLGGSTLTTVSTGTFALQAPIALALDGAGNLYIADYSLGEVIEVPTTTGLAPSMVIPPGGLLQHPIALTVDNLGDLYIGDAGPAGFAAGTGNPGYVVKIPVGGAAFKMTLPTVSVIFPQSLVTDFYTNNLFIGDGGDPSGVGQVVGVTPDGSIGGPLALSGVTNPTGLAFDPAGNLYILDGLANTITIDPIYSSAPPYLLNFKNTLLSAASAMAISAGGQSFVIANIGAGSDNNLVLVNGNRSTLAFGGVTQGTQSDPLTATEYNIGNLNLTLGNPFFSSATSNSAFSILGSSTCGANQTLTVGSSCSINVEFTPASIGQTTEQITVNSTGYNTGVPILTLQGTGKAAGSVAKKTKH
jgi:sugar lactone lactonase YvrE